MRHPPPETRRLRAYSFDPSLGGDITRSDINEIALEIPWEEVTVGPIGEYIEVIDYDPASALFYPPVDLNDTAILARGGLEVSETEPQFHQQMVYAVAMATIDHFEQAFGRKIFWSNRVQREPSYDEFYVPRLRIYPHALRARNAYYSPAKKALLFGYFPVTAKDEANAPGTTVFACLSHDIIVHEMSHALLDGVHPRFNEPTNPDVHAFHEAFADIVAIFQRFSYPGVLETTIRNTRGDLGRRNILAQLAQQFGRATGRGSALRDALGGIDPKTGEWVARKPDPRALEHVYEPHDRGAILVAAVFRAFNLCYARKTADLFRLATGGTGVLPDGALHPDLVGRLATEARVVAARVLRMCIRGLDYCPPVDLTFGDYLRAVVTADLDVTPADEDGCRVAFVQAFREWGIAAAGVRSVSVESLSWDDFATAGARAALGLARRPTEQAPATTQTDGRALAREAQNYATMLRSQKGSLQEQLDQQDKKAKAERAGRRRPTRAGEAAITIRVPKPWGDRMKTWREMDRVSYAIWQWLTQSNTPTLLSALNLVLDPVAPATVWRGRKSGLPSLEIHAVRPVTRHKRRGGDSVALVIEVTQRRRGFFDPKVQAAKDALKPGAIPYEETGDFTYRAGSTFFLDPETLDIHWVIPTAGSVTDDGELARMRDYLTGDSLPRMNAFDAGMRSMADTTERRIEPFAMLHDHGD